MKIKLVDRGWPRRLAWIIALVAALPQLFFPLVLPADYPAVYPVLLAVAMGVFALLVFLLDIEIDKWWGMIAEQVCIALVAAVIIHLPMFDRSYASPWAILNSALIFLTLQMVFFMLFGNCKPFGAVLLTVCFVYGVINYEVFQFTENMISLGQILSVQTAVNVVGNYRFVMGPYVLSSAIMYACAMAALFRIRNVRLGKLLVRGVALVCAVLAAIMPAMAYQKRGVKIWKSNAMYNGIGIPLELLLEYRTSRNMMPQGYTPEAAAKLAEYTDEAPDDGEGARPHVIALMLEAFSDLTVLGDFEISEDPLAYTRSLGDESIHGYYMASTYAGGTSRTEWEFLTGNSMYNVSDDSIPFKQFVSGETNSLTRVFKNAGYHTIGMHCFDGNGWDRYRVYPELGFDDIYFEDDQEWDGRVRDYVSDTAFVHKAIELFEANDTGKPLFMFGVSMQNHGGYDYEGFEADVFVEGLDTDCAKPNQYLSLMKRSDEAIRDLIEYFRGVDEPVEIVVFGDHQPRMPDEFYEEVGMEQYGQKYITPYLIWKNYDDTSEETHMISANYIATRALRESGVEMPPYYCFLEKLSEKLPFICGLGYQYGDAIYPRGEYPNGEAEALLDEYAFYQYANMFDDTVDPALFQGSAE